MPFTNQTLVQLLILFLLFLSCSRFVFMRREKEDSLAVLPLAVFIIAAVNVFAFGLNIQNIYILVLSFIVFIINVRALLRLAASLVIDRYGWAFIISSIICLGFAVYGIIEVLDKMPVKVSSSRYEVSLTEENYTGSLVSGFKKTDKPFEKVTLRLHKAEPLMKKSGQKKKAVFVTPVTADFSVYEAFICMLAREGYTVYCGEFSSDENNFTGSLTGTSFLRKFYFRSLKLSSPDEYKKIMLSKKNVLTEDYKVLLKIADADASDSVTAVLDVFDDDTDYSAELSGLPSVDHVFAMKSVPEYKTPGWGPVENTEPVFARKLGVEKDTGFFISNFLAQKAAGSN
ncbi:MAG: hypothetical protein J5780_06900 [Treponema sp.]|nr:hypothetical protein [Treponema sp.]